MNKQIVKLINKLSEHNINVFYVKQETFDLVSKRVKTNHIFERYDQGQFKEEYITESEKKAVEKLVNSLAEYLTDIKYGE